LARIRSIKPGFWTNEHLADLSAFHRLTFIGLWTQADREGRIEDRPKRLKAALFPYDGEAAMGVTMDQVLADLAAAGFILRYQVGDGRYIALPNFSRHQLISRDEPASEIPGPDGEITPFERAPNETIRARIYQRDNYLCLYCGRDLTKQPRLRCVDHVIPYARGGSHAEINLVTACKTCNAKKGCRNPKEAEMPWPQGFGAPLTESGPPVNGSVLLGEGKWELELVKGEGGKGDTADADPPSTPDDLMAAWNELTQSPAIPRCRDLTIKRRKQGRARLTERPIEEWRDVFKAILASAFCRGENDRGWSATFDWVIGSPEVALKVLEGKYADRRSGPRPAVKEAPGVDWWEECQRLHDRKCNGQHGHALQMGIDAQREAS
jgi:hypothetical protein